MRAYEYIRYNKPLLFEDFVKKNVDFTKLRNTQNKQYYNKINNFCLNAYDKLDKKPQLFLNKRDIEGLNSDLFSIGLHNHEHPRLSMLSYEEQKADIGNNIKILSKYSNYKPYWALPFGTEKDWNRDTIRLAIEKDLILFFHTGGIIKNNNSLGFDRMPCDGGNFKNIIKKIMI